jgi:hypothetical protein
MDITFGRLSLLFITCVMPACATHTETRVDPIVSGGTVESGGGVTSNGNASSEGASGSTSQNSAAHDGGGESRGKPLPSRPARSSSRPPSQGSQSLLGGDAAPLAPANPDAPTATLVGLPVGSATVIAPQHAMQYIGFSVVLTVSYDTVTVLIKKQQTGPPDEVVHPFDDSVHISDYMTAEISGVGCMPVPETDAKKTQRIVKGTDNTWTWTIECDSFGDKILSIELDTLSDKNGGPGTPIERKGVKVAISVNPAEFFRRNWQWLATTLFVPAFAWAVKRWLDKRNESGQAAST